MRSQFWGARLYALDKNLVLASALEPFDKDMFAHGSGSAYPPDRSHAIFPAVIGVGWSNAAFDKNMSNALRRMSGAIRTTALADGQNVSHAAAYVNYAHFDRPLEDMYGGNVDRLRQIRLAVDPEVIMGLAGGWKF
jgi:hypothetical protein